jgi:hypothetical protein
MRPLRIVITKWVRHLNYCDTFLAAITVFWKECKPSLLLFRTGRPHLVNPTLVIPRHLPDAR